MTIPDGITSLPNGQWVLKHDSHLSRWAEQHGSVISDPNLMRFLTPVLEPVSVVWDVGAFIGDHTRHYCDLGKTVVAVEPNPLAFRCLEHNCPEAKCLNIAASSSFEKLTYAVNPNAGASRIHPSGEFDVAGYPLDAMGLPIPGFVKIDVEGFEMKALAGMEGIISTAKPIVFIEVNRGALEANGNRPEDIREFFKGHGYTRFEMYPARAQWEWPQFDLLIRP